MLILAETNRDGDLSTSELSTHVNNVSDGAPRRPRNHLQKYAILMNLNENADDQITADEIGVVIMLVAQSGEVNVFLPSSRTPFRSSKSTPTNPVTPKK